MVLNDKNPWNGMLVPTMFVLRATVHIMTQYTPAQLVFRRDLTLNTRHKANWKSIKKHKHDLIDMGNKSQLYRTHVQQR